MSSKVLYFILCISCLFRNSFQQKYVVPEATVQLLYPIGFSVSIPDKEGIRLFAFHGRINEEFTSRADGGSYSKDITKAKDNKWTFTDKTTRFKIGDTINYWLYVDYFDGRNQLGYVSEFRKFIIKECPRNIVDEQGFCNAPDTSKYVVPNPTVEILQPRGFSVSIPDQDGITLFAFHGKINEEFDGRESGDFARDITIARNGRWTFTDEKTKLNPGDVIYYWVNVYHKNKKGNTLAYIKEDLKYVVPGSQDMPGESCSESVTIWNGIKACVGQVLFEEQFEVLNPNNWTREIKYADEPDYEFVIYDNFEENLSVKNGELHIKPTLADDRFGEGFIFSSTGYDLGSSCTSDVLYNCKRQSVGGYGLPPIISGKINSKNFFKYGRVDIRAKLPKGDWIYPQLSLTSKRHEYGSKNYDSGEIRIAFVGGNANLNDELQAMILLGTSLADREFGTRKLKTSNQNWSNDYHIFSVLWKPDSITFLVDNMEYAKIVPPPGGFSNIFYNKKPETAAKWKLSGHMAPFDKEMSITLGVGVGGHSFPDTIPGKSYTNTEAKPQVKFYRRKNTWKPTWNHESELIVDYVKVFAL